MRERSLARTAKDTSQCLRAGIGATRDVLARYGYYYHGHAIRRIRAVKQTELPNPPQENTSMEPNNPESLELHPSPQAASNLQRRIEELQQQAIAAPGDLFAIKFFTAQLVPISLQLHQLLKASLGDAASLDEASPRLRTALDLYFRVVRQGERNIRLARDLERAAAGKLEAAASEES